MPESRRTSASSPPSHSPHKPMSAQILSGKEPAKALLTNLQPAIIKLNPKLVIVQVGNDARSTAYINQKLKACDAVGMRRELVQLKDKTSLDAILGLIQELNLDPDVSGCLVQMPLPGDLNKSASVVQRAIDPRKDVDGLHPFNQGSALLSKDLERLAPATPTGIIRLLEHYKIDVAGKHAVILGRSAIVGKPLSAMLLNRDATVTVCHSKTPGLSTITRLADLLFVAIGQPKFITADMVKPGAVIIDIGITQEEEGLTGDVDFASLKDIASAISPVPGGVGPMTVASLMANVVRAAEMRGE